MKPSQVSEKNTKSQILEAYESMREQARELYKKNKQQEQALAKQGDVIKEAGEQTSAGVQQNLTSLRQQINDQISLVGEKMSEETKRLETIQQAIKLEEANLKEMYEINKTAHTLDTLLLAHKQEESQFTLQISDKREQWQKEQQTFTQNFKESQEQLKKTWRREQDEYNYQTKLTRQKEQDEYQTLKNKQTLELTQQREQLNEDFSQREMTIKQQEADFAALKQQVEKFPETLAAELSAHETLTTERLVREHQFQFDLLSKEREGERKLSEQTIASLELKLRSQEQLIAQLGDKANQSLSQVQDIAVKAIEGASSQPKNFYYPSDKVKVGDMKEV